jgi:hypothetical protein
LTRQAGHDEDLHEDLKFTRGLIGLKASQDGGGFGPLSEPMNFLNCLNCIPPPPMPDVLTATKGLWTSLLDWIGASSFKHVNKDKRLEKIFSDANSAIAQELESEIDRATRLWLDAPKPLGRDPNTEAESPFYNRLGIIMISFGVGIQRLQNKGCFDGIKRLRFRLITQRAQAPPLDDPRRMAFFGRYGDRDVRYLLGMYSSSGAPALGEVPSRGEALFRPAVYGFGRVSWQWDSKSRQQREVLG